jgi:hypothetical protein
MLVGDSSPFILVEGTGRLEVVKIANVRAFAVRWTQQTENI